MNRAAAEQHSAAWGLVRAGGQDTPKAKSDGCCCSVSRPHIVEGWCLPLPSVAAPNPPKPGSSTVRCNWATNQSAGSFAAKTYSLALSRKPSNAANAANAANVPPALQLSADPHSTANARPCSPPVRRQILLGQSPTVTLFLVLGLESRYGCERTSVERHLRRESGMLD